eukprot:GHUV01052751.1.p1 GENE.GHUV01052751.1~~GHUV01052751.1.p1  ORF type:complete len:107 (+),score=9.59 GHUV01052751.1:3-323(+)
MDQQNPNQCPDITLRNNNKIQLSSSSPVATVNLNASVPYLPTTSNGSITLPRDLLILRPLSSRTSPCKYTVWKGDCPVSARPIMIMRATQKNRISWPVSRTCNQQQ